MKVLSRQNQYNMQLYYSRTLKSILMYSAVWTSYMQWNHYDIFSRKYQLSQYDSLPNIHQEMYQ